MRVLIDSHILLWIVEGSSRLSREGQRIVCDAAEVYVSAATVWEIAIKAALGKLRVVPDELLEEIDEGGFHHLPVLARHAARVADLPHLHGDPFDRLLVAQAIAEQMRLLTADPTAGGVF